MSQIPGSADVPEFAAALTGTAVRDESAAFETFVQFLFSVIAFWSHTRLYDGET